MSLNLASQGYSVVCLVLVSSWATSEGPERVIWLPSTISQIRLFVCLLVCFSKNSGMVQIPEDKDDNSTFWLIITLGSILMGVTMLIIVMVFFATALTARNVNKDIKHREKNDKMKRRHTMPELPTTIIKVFFSTKIQIPNPKFQIESIDFEVSIDWLIICHNLNCSINFEKIKTSRIHRVNWLINYIQYCSQIWNLTCAVSDF